MSLDLINLNIDARDLSASPLPPPGRTARVIFDVQPERR